MKVWPSLSPAGMDCTTSALPHLPEKECFVCPGVAAAAMANSAHAYTNVYLIFPPQFGVSILGSRDAHTLLRVVRKEQRLLFAPMSEGVSAHSKTSGPMFGR